MLNKEIIKAVVEYVGGDFHTVVTPEAILELGVPESIVQAIIEPYEGRFGTVPSVCLGDLVKRLCRELGYATPKLGLGSAGRDCSEYLNIYILCN
jgi:hypothetical protein